MPARSAKHGRSSKTSRNPPVAPAPTAELLVDFDPFHASENTYEGEALSRSDIDTAPPSEFSTPAEPPSRLPVHEQEEPGEEETSFFHHDPNDIPGEPHPEPEADTDAAPPIPIPVPRSQTPQLLPPPPHRPPSQSDLASSSHSSSVPPSLHNRFSYGYAHPPPPPSIQTPKSQHPNPNPSAVSGLARTIRAPAHSGTPAKRFTAPLSMAPAAPAIVDLGTASREFGLGLEHEGERKRVEGRHGKGKEEVVWARWDVVDTSTGPRQHKRLLFVAYASTLQIWDTTDLEGISQVLSIPFAQLALGEEEEEEGGASLVHAAVLPRRKSMRGKEEGKGEEGECLIGLA